MGYKPRHLVTPSQDVSAPFSFSTFCPATNSPSLFLLCQLSSSKGSRRGEDDCGIGKVLQNHNQRIPVGPRHWNLVLRAGAPTSRPSIHSPLSITLSITKAIPRSLSSLARCKNHYLDANIALHFVRHTQYRKVYSIHFVRHIAIERAIVFHDFDACGLIGIIRNRGWVVFMKVLVGVPLLVLGNFISILSILIRARF